MSDDIEQLRQKYRDIKAPAHLATRIRAEVADRPVRSQNWMPVGATAMAVVIVAWLAPYMGEQPSGPSAISSPWPPIWKAAR